MDAERWATFDCYGTLIDWNGGIRATLAGIFGESEADALLVRYHEVEPAVQAERYRTYREVLDLVTAALAREGGGELAPADATAMSDSLAAWPAFPEVPAALAEAKRRGWRLVILSNCDRDLIASSVPKLGVEFDDVIVAQDVGSYKPAPGHWERFDERHPGTRGRHVHVGASRFHDVVPASELGLPSVWINRLGEPPEPRAGAQLHDLADLPDALDALLPA
ncbi:MAG TPA: HAD-IA family hydrolase [Gaiellales bacterium]|jgi:2-haloacid dehalogenase